MVMFAASKLCAESGVAEMFLILSTYYVHAVLQDSRSSHNITTSYAEGSVSLAA